MSALRITLLLTFEFFNTLQNLRTMVETDNKKLTRNVLTILRTYNINDFFYPSLSFQFPT